MLRSRHEIVEAAGALFARFGYAGTTFSRIARAIDRPKSAIGYHLFSSKAALAAAVLTDDDMRWRTIDDALERAGLPMGTERLISLLLSRMRGIESHPERAGALRLLLDLPAFDVEDGAPAEGRTGVERIRYVCDCLAADLPSSPGSEDEVESFAELLLDSTRGLVLCHVAKQPHEPLDSRLCALWASLLNGAGVPRAEALVRRVQTSTRLPEIMADVERELVDESADRRVAMR
ncbi:MULTISPECIES: TetR/AcrR family transcriptional regulator [unclassified Clavibacter]|uniref:TetR/AcrR family transcriptional regulator n=1 Tax=unclassified Clavibacter TaxID=2626594 RepID=UPI0022EACE91|nr:TetR/AcrR family transcriptional regulator [Clavibacter sp. CT19]MDA3804314.1 helix-turn-helix domain containing protein [Clavibacter sp. CT19]